LVKQRAGWVAAGAVVVSVLAGPAVWQVTGEEREHDELGDRCVGTLPVEAVRSFLGGDTLAVTTDRETVGERELGSVACEVRPTDPTDTRSVRVEIGGSDEDLPGEFIDSRGNASGRGGLGGVVCTRLGRAAAGVLLRAG
jgi:hypothetical protein